MQICHQFLGVHLFLFQPPFRYFFASSSSPSLLSSSFFSLFFWYCICKYTSNCLTCTNTRIFNCIFPNAKIDLGADHTSADTANLYNINEKWTRKKNTNEKTEAHNKKNTQQQLTNRSGNRYTLKSNKPYNGTLMAMFHFSPTNSTIYTF